MYSMAMMSFFVEDKNIDKNKILKMSIVHDLQESICGVKKN